MFEAAQAELRTLVDDEGRYTPLLGTLLSEAVGALGGSDNVTKVIVNPADEAKIQNALKENGLEGKLETSDTVKGGVKVRGQSNVTIENGLFDRLSSAREDLASEVSRQLGVSSATPVSPSEA